MTEPRGYDPASTPSIEVQVFRHGHLVLTELCDSEDDAADVIDRWSELPGVQCLIQDLSSPVRGDDALLESDVLDDRLDERRLDSEGPRGVP
jgi:hypothetical protein